MGSSSFFFFSNYNGEKGVGSNNEGVEMVRKFDSLFKRRATVKKRSFSVKKSTRLVMYNFQIFCTIFLIITTLITRVVPQLTDNVPSAVDDGIVKKVKKINQDGSYTIGYLSDDGSYKIEHRDIFGNINGTFGWLDEQNQTKKVNYSSKNATAPVKLVSIAQTTPTLISAASISSTTSSIPTFVQRIPTRTTLMVTPTATTTTTTGLPNYSIDSTNDNDDVYNSGNIVSSSPRPLFTTTRHHLSKLSNSPFFSTTTPLPAAPSSSSSSSSVIVQNNGQFFSTSTTPASNFLVQKKVIVQKPVPADNDNYYQVEEPEPEVSEIRKRFFSPPPPPPPPPSSPVIFLPSVVVDDDQENNNNEIIDEIQPPVSTHAFQMLLRHLIDRQRKLEYVNMLTRQRHQATNRRHYYQYQQADNMNDDEYLPINVREMLLLRMLQLAMNPALPVHVGQNQEAAQNSYYRRQHRNVEILGEEGAEIRQQRRRRTKRYKKSDNMLIGEDEEMDYVE